MTPREILTKSIEQLDWLTKSSHVSATASNDITVIATDLRAVAAQLEPTPCACDHCEYVRETLGSPLANKPATVRPPKEMHYALLPFWTPKQRVYQCGSNSLQWMFPAMRAASSDGQWETSTAERRRIRDGDRLLPNVIIPEVPNLKEPPMPTQTPETIAMKFHPLPATPKRVEPKFLKEFPLGSRVTTGCYVYMVVLSPKKEAVALSDCHQTFEDNPGRTWYLESDWIDGKPRELPQEPVRKRVDEMKVGDVFELPSGRVYVAATGNETWAVYLDKPGCPQRLPRHYYMQHIVLGHVTFG